MKVVFIAHLRAGGGREQPACCRPGRHPAALGRAGAARVLPFGVGLLFVVPRTFVCQECLVAGITGTRVSLASGEPSAGGGVWAAVLGQQYLGVQLGSEELQLSVPWGAVGSVQTVNTNISNDLVRQAAKDRTGSVIPLKSA